MLPGEMVGRIRCVSIASDTNPHAKYKRGAVSRSPLVRLESELLQVFQNSIKQLQCCNNEFEDKNGDIHQAHTRLLGSGALPADVPFRCLLPAVVHAVSQGETLCLLT